LSVDGFVLVVPKKFWGEVDGMVFPFVAEVNSKRVDGKRVEVCFTVIDSKNRKKFIKKARPNYESFVSKKGVD